MHESLRTLALLLAIGSLAGCMSCPNGSRPVTNPSEARASGYRIGDDQTGADQDYVCVPNTP